VSNKVSDIAAFVLKWTLNSNQPTSGKGGYVFVALCLSVRQQLCAKTSERICMKFSAKIGNGPVNKSLNFGCDPDDRLDTEIVFRIRHYRKIWKVINGTKSAAHTDSPVGGTGMTCHGGGIY